MFAFLDPLLKWSTFSKHTEKAKILNKENISGTSLQLVLITGSIIHLNLSPHKWEIGRTQDVISVKHKHAFETSALSKAWKLQAGKYRPHWKFFELFFFPTNPVFQCIPYRKRIDTPTRSLCFKTQVAFLVVHKKYIGRQCLLTKSSKKLPMWPILSSL